MLFNNKQVYSINRLKKLIKPTQSVQYKGKKAKNLKSLGLIKKVRLFKQPLYSISYKFRLSFKKSKDKINILARSIRRKKFRKLKRIRRRGAFFGF